MPAFNFLKELLSAVRLVVDRYLDNYQQYIDRESKNLVADLKRRSPVGATGQLKNGWKRSAISRVRGKLSLQVTVYNTAPDAYNRMFGRKPGKMPPVEALEPWVRAKMGLRGTQARGVAFVIAKSIAARGTQRYRSKENFLGLTETSKTFTDDSPVQKAIEKIVKLINQFNRSN